MIYTNTIYIKYSILLCIIIIFCIHLCKNNLKFLNLNWIYGKNSSYLVSPSNELHHRRTVKSELMKNPIIDYFSSLLRSTESKTSTVVNPVTGQAFTKSSSSSSLDHSQRAQGCGDQCPKPAPLARDPEATNLLNDLVAAPTEPLFSCLT